MYTTYAAQDVHAEHCTRTRAFFTPKRADLRSIGASLRLPMPNTVHVHVQGARLRALTCNRSTAEQRTCVIRYIDDKCTTQKSHPEHCANTRTCTSARHVRVTRSVDAERLTRTHTPTHDGRYNARAAHADHRTCTHTRVYIQDTVLELPTSNAVPHAHPRKMSPTSSSINSDRTSCPGEQ